MSANIIDVVFIIDLNLEVGEYEVIGVSSTSKAETNNDRQAIL